MSTTFATLLQAQVKDRLSKVDGGLLFNVKAADGIMPISTQFNHAMREAGLQPWMCSTCDKFLTRYGRMVTVNPVTGELKSVLWSGDRSILDDATKHVVETMDKWVTTGKVTSLVIAPECKPSVIGTIESGGFDHLHVDTTPDYFTYKPEFKKAVDVNRGRLITFMNDHRHNVPQLRDLIEHLKGSDNHRCNRFAASLASQVDNLELLIESKLTGNLLWNMAACFGVSGRAGIKGTTVGEVFDCFMTQGADNALRLARSMTAPGAYQIPTATMAEINSHKFNAANKAIGELGYIDSLKRRPVNAEEVIEHALWVRTGEDPEVVEETNPLLAARGVEPKPEDKRVEIGTVQEVTMATFISEVLSKAERLYINTTARDRGLSVGTIMGAFNKGSKPILKWATEENPTEYSWTLNPRLEPANSIWGGDRIEVDTVFRLPCEWNGAEFKGFEGLVFDSQEFAKAAAKNNHPIFNNSLFPEFCKAELWDYRQVIEAMNKATEHHVEELNLFITKSQTAKTVPLMYVDNGKTLTPYRIVLW